jgi:hypothetical protein
LQWQTRKKERKKERKKGGRRRYVSTWHTAHNDTAHTDNIDTHTTQCWGFPLPHL